MYTASHRTYSISDTPSAIAVPPHEYASEGFLQIGSAALGFPLACIMSEVGAHEIVFKLDVDTDVLAVLTLFGRLTEGEDAFRLEQMFLRVKSTKKNARAVFVASTVIAMLALKDDAHLQIPIAEYDLKIKIDLPLPEISHLLQWRQTASRLMVIEQATGLQFLLPQEFSEDEKKTIAFIYHAIVDRSFDWPIETITLNVRVTREWFTRSFPDKQPAPQLASFPPRPATRAVLGHRIALGNETMVIEDSIIENADEVQRELARNDGHLVKVVARSLSGRARINLPEAPRLPDAPWDSKIQALIDLEPQLVARLADRYHALAAATLADLTEEEKAIVTARPELDEEAFLMNDLD